MISLIYHRNFKKGFKKLNPTEKKSFKERIALFVLNPNDPVLNNHPLHGKYTGCRSINITGDLRAVFENITDTIVLLSAIDTHSKLYR